MCGKAVDRVFSTAKLYTPAQLRLILGWRGVGAWSRGKHTVLQSLAAPPDHLGLLRVGT